MENEGRGKEGVEREGGEGRGRGRREREGRGRGEEGQRDGGREGWIGWGERMGVIKKNTVSCIVHLVDSFKL